MIVLYMTTHYYTIQYTITRFHVSLILPNVYLLSDYKDNLNLPPVPSPHYLLHLYNSTILFLLIV